VVEKKYAYATENGEPAAPYQNLVNEINALIDSFGIYVSRPEKTPESPANPAL
jgi:hypothetical protein